MKSLVLILPIIVIFYLTIVLNKLPQLMIDILNDTREGIREREMHPVKIAIRIAAFILLFVLYLLIWIFIGLLALVSISFILKH